MLKKILYENKVAIQNDENILRKNKVTDEDMNEIKDVINNNAQELENICTDIESEQSIQNTNISDLQSDNTINKNNITEIKEKETAQDKLIEELKEENARLKEDINSRPSGTLSGESIDINDSAEMRFKEFKISGNSKQEKREGYNLLPNNLESKTINGVSITVNKDKSITLDGTCSQFFQMVLLNTTDNPIVLQPDTYTISYKNKVSGLNLVGTENGIDVPYLLSSNTQNSITKTYSEEITINKVVSAISTGTVFSNLTLYPMIYKGSSEKEYEQYGVMPSTEYPSEIKSCGDNGSINIEICNNNILPISLLSGTTNGVNYKVNSDNSITLNGTATAYFTLDLFEGEQILEKGAYTYSLGNKQNGINMLGIENEKEVIYLTASNSSDKITKALNEKTILTKVKTSITSGTSFNKFTIYPMICKGEIKQYISNQSQSYTIPTQQTMLEEDYFDLDNEQEVHIWEKIQNYNGEQINTEYKSTLGELTKGATVYYKLEETKKIPFTEQQKLILKQIKNKVKSYKGVTHIYSTDEISPNIEVTYFKDIEIMLNNIQPQILSEEVNNNTEESEG